MNDEILLDELNELAECKLCPMDLMDSIDEYANQRVAKKMKDVIEDLEILVMQNEDDFDRGRGKHIIWKELERMKEEISCSLSNKSDNNKQ
jgi:hypothetical protein